MAFDARSIKALAPGEHLTSEDCPGLRLLAKATRRTWVYRYRSAVDDKLRQMRLGIWPAMSVHAAIAEWERLRRERERGGDPVLEANQAREAERAAAALVAERATRTVAAVARDYWEGHVRLSRAPKGAAEVKRIFDTMLGEAGALPADEVTRAQAFDLIRSYAESAPVQAKRLRMELGAAWDWAIDSGRLPESTPNWWRQILRGKIKSRGKRISGELVGTKKRVLKPDEVGRLIRWLPNFTALVEDVLTLYLWTGTRGAEIVGMEGREIHREADGLMWWVVPKEKTKSARHANATDLRVPLFGRARSVVMRRRERFGDGFLFPATTRDGGVRAVEQKTVQTAVYYHQPYSETRPEAERPRLTVTHWAPHDLRRTARTMLASLGCPAEVAEAILGHMAEGVEGIYNLHEYDAERVEWLRRLDAELEALAAG